MGLMYRKKPHNSHKPKERFFIKGFAEDVNDVMKNAKLCTAYLPFGAGLKGKLFDAMQNGTPCAMNTIAAEGMFGLLDINGIKEDAVDAFVKQTAELYTNKSLWSEKQANGFKALNSRFNASNFNLLQLVRDLQLNINKHRQIHFLGQVLQHHSLQSSKYMSKWIEAKNR